MMQPRPARDGLFECPKAGTLQLVDAAHAFRLQAEACADMESPLYATLLSAAAEDIDAGGVIAELVAGWPGEPRNDALALRVMGATHLLALDGTAPGLAEHYPSCGGRPRGTVAAVFLRTVAEHMEQVRRGLRHPPQTNEVGRSAILLGGLLELQELTDLPIDIFEVGAAAGLNVHLDRFSYELGNSSWGDTNSGVHIESEWTGQLPPTSQALRIERRSACDAAPLDIGDETDVLRLQSYVWPDHEKRRERLLRAIAVASRSPVSVEAADAATWVADVAPRRGALTVVCHTVVLQYLTADTRKRFTARVRSLGSRATSAAPVAWLRFEPGQHAFELRRTLYPGGVDLVAAEAHPHGRWVTWLGR